jgi:hypothetical protein
MNELLRWLKLSNEISQTLLCAPALQLLFLSTISQDKRIECNISADTRLSNLLGE